jgi:uncharacterized protein (TIGR03118 family)
MSRTRITPPRRVQRVMLVAALAATPLWSAPGVAVASNGHHQGSPAFTEVNLISNVPGRAAVTDPLVVNAWGLALSPTSPLWIANNGTNTASIYAGGVGGATPTPIFAVTIPGGAPTGQAFNGSSDFVVTGPGGSGPARFLFVSEDGDVTGWNPTADFNNAIVAAHVDGANYKGLAIGQSAFGRFLLAANFSDARIDVFDAHFNHMPLPAGVFSDPGLPAGYAPFDVAILDGHVYVAYALVDPATNDEVAGRGLGFVDVYSLSGQLEKRLVKRGPLNAPWGLEIAPDSFGKFAGDLLVGNFGDGRINVFDRSTGHFEGTIQGADGAPIVIDGLWALLRGTASTGGTDAVWFSAGPDEEANGLVGQIRPATG